MGPENAPDVWVTVLDTVTAADGVDYAILEEVYASEILDEGL